MICKQDIIHAIYWPNNERTKCVKVDETKNGHYWTTTEVRVLGLIKYRRTQLNFRKVLLEHPTVM
jgi:hypothetical protein